MMDWAQDKILKLLTLYKTSRHLWDPREQFYYDVGKKNEAWQEIAARLDVPREECKKKMESLKASYRREKAKTRRSNNTGGEQGEDGWKSRWFAFETMKFLDEATGPREVVGWNSDYSEEPTEDGLETQQPPRKTARTSHRTTSSRRVKNDDTHKQINHTTASDHQDANAIPDVSTYLHQYYKPTSGDLVDVEAVQNECSTFGAYVASKLRKYGDRERAIAQHRIASVFFDLDMALYSVDPSSLPPPPLPLQLAASIGSGGPSQTLSTHDIVQERNIAIKERNSTYSDSS